MTAFTIRPIDDDHDVSDTVYLCASYEPDGTPRELWIGYSDWGNINVRIGVGYTRETLEAILANTDIMRELLAVSASRDDEYFTTCGYEGAIEFILRDYEPDWHEWDVGDYAYDVAIEYLHDCVMEGDNLDTDHLADQIRGLAHDDKILLVGDVDRCVRYWLDDDLPVHIAEYLRNHGSPYTYDDLDDCEYTVTYTDAWLKIGCQAHHIDAWRAFTDREIAHFGCPCDVALWRKHRLAIFAAMARFNSQFGE
jgi:hypothetical protein